MKKDVSLFELFKSTFLLSAFTFGGGYVIVSLMKDKFVDQLGWIGEDEMLDLVAISQSAPGAMAINASIIVGYKLYGFIGAVIATFGTVLPPFFIITVVSFFYELFASNFVVAQLLEGMQAGVGAVIASVVYDMAAKQVKTGSPFAITVMVLAFAASLVFHVSVITIVLVAIGLGIFVAAYKKAVAK